MRHLNLGSQQLTCSSECVSVDGKRHTCELYILVYVFGNQTSSVRLSCGDVCVLSVCCLMMSLDLILQRVPVTQTERNGPRAGWMRGERCYMLLKRASVLQHLCGRTVYVCLCVYTYMHLCPCVYGFACVYVWKKKLPLNNMCSHCLQLLVGVCNTQEGAKRRHRRGGDRWAASDLKR